MKAFGGQVVGFLVMTAVLTGAVLSQIPEGTLLSVRLTTPVSSETSKINDRVEAITIAPVPGLRLHGRVKSVESASESKRAYLKIEFEGARVIDVDNARESVDPSGGIVGILASESLAAQMDRGLEKLSGKHGNAAGVLQAIKTIMVEDIDPEIKYAAGIDMTLKLTKPMHVDVPDKGATSSEPPNPALVVFIRQQPSRTQAERPALPSDWINLMFLGSGENIEKAFKAAGWTPAAPMNTASVLETARAIIESRGYQEAPVSKLRLQGRLPDMVFQKMNNTFAERHHLRIWRRPLQWRGQDVWVGAATHDNGIAFASDERTFYHTIDPDIDEERKKVVDDLEFTGLATLEAIIGRPEIPRESTNATGDLMVTDGKIAIVRVQRVQ